jgi:hypothetical protein
MNPEEIVEFGNLFPFDAPDNWWNIGAMDPPKPKDWAHSAARGIIASLKDRKGIKEGLSYEIDEDIRVEIIEEIASIIRDCSSKKDLW